MNRLKHTCTASSWPGDTRQNRYALPSWVAQAAGDQEVFIGGGAQIYAQALPLAGRMYLTQVHADVEGDTIFPPYDANQWAETYTEYHPVDERHPYAFTFKILERKPGSVLNSI